MSGTGKSIADMISAETKTMVEKTGETYKPIFSPDEETNNNPTDAERKQFSEDLAKKVEAGTKAQKEYDKWYFETYGTKNSHGNSYTVSEY